MGGLRLVKPSIAYKEAYMNFYEEWIRSGESIVPWVVERDPSDFEAYVAFLYSADNEEKIADNGWVPHTTYWLLDGQDRVVGAANFRHRLNGKLLESGGHIGYGIRPSERKKGYASFLLGETLGIARRMKLARVLLVCDHDNEASERTIRRNGGVLENELTTEDGNRVKRFWIGIGEEEGFNDPCSQ
jgi:predicted acetyltransferase